VKAPAALRALKANCGPMSVWLALQSLGITRDEKDILRCCKYRKGKPTFLICIAVGLLDLGLKIEFRTDPDPEVHPDERLCIEDAQKRGLSFGRALPIRSLFRRAGRSGRLILSYDGDNGEGHFSPVSYVDSKTIWLVYDNPASGSFRELERRRKQPGNCRQSLTVFAR
jgi:hypothetical protein